MPNEKKQTTDAQNLVAFLNSVSNVIADKVNPAFKSKYASLSEILDTVKAEAAKHDIAVHQTLSSAEGQVRVTTTFIHASGAVVDCGTLAFLAPGDAQKLGSAITYLRRQSLQTACGISTDVDDDGAKASGSPHKPAARPDVWHHFIPADKLPKAKEYLVAKGWLPAEASIETLGNQHQMVIAENQAAFLKAISK
jgi:hypothetical protein